MRKVHRAFSFIVMICFFISLAYPQQGSFKIGNIKYDYNNLEFSFAEGSDDITFKIGRFSLSTSNNPSTLKPAFLSESKPPSAFATLSKPISFKAFVAKADLSPRAQNKTIFFIFPLFFS